MPRKYPVRCPMCGGGSLKIQRRSVITQQSIKEFIIKKCGEISSRGHYIIKDEDIKELWFLECPDCNYSEITSGPDE